jgi:hypothetical protein
MRDVPALDLALEDLRSGAPGWADLPLRAKIAMLEALPPRIVDVAPRMAAAATEAKGIASTSAWVAEEWTINIWVFVQAINTQILVLKRVLAGHEPVNADAVHTGPDGQVVVDVFPATGYDRLLLNGYKAQVWIEPGVSAEQTRAQAAALYRGTDPSDPEVCLVLGAGNLGAITALDIIDQLYIRGNVCAVKMNPVNEYLGPFYEHIFSEFISRGWLRLLYGGADVGGYLAHHPEVDIIHMTGWEATIKPPAANQQRPLLTSQSPELRRRRPSSWCGGKPEGCRAYRHSNSSTHNCTRFVIGDSPSDKHRRSPRSATPNPVPHYPAQIKITSACRRNPTPPSPTSPHGGAGIHTKPCRRRATSGKTVTVLHNAVEPPTMLRGNLGAVITIDPKTRKQNAQAFDAAMAHLRYGAIGINTWTGMAFALATWGAFPGNTAQDIGSGTGTVHNTFMLPRPQKAVVEIPFRPAPRSLFNGELTLSPKPVFFITNKTAETTARRLVRFLIRRNPIALPRIFLSALRG